MDSPTMLLMNPSPTGTVTVTPFHSASTSPYITAPSSPRHRAAAAAADPSDDFSFDFSGELDRNFPPADELFDGGVIRPLSKSKASRSLSPEPEPPNPPSWYKKWRISDLFRSASESRAIDERSRQQRKKYYPLLKKPRREELSNSKGSYRSVGSESSRRTRSGPLVSAHEVHYTINRANSQEMKRRTFLPYRQGLLACLGFHHPQLYKQRV